MGRGLGKGGNEDYIRVLVFSQSLLMTIVRDKKKRESMR